MAVFFEGRQTQNSEDNIELGDGGDMTSVVWYFMGWLFFFSKNPVLILKTHQNSIFIELDDGKILTGKPDQFDGKNPWVSG